MTQQSVPSGPAVPAPVVLSAALQDIGGTDTVILTFDQPMEVDQGDDQAFAFEGSFGQGDIQGSEWISDTVLHLQPETMSAGSAPYTLSYLLPPDSADRYRSAAGVDLAAFEDMPVTV